MEQIPGPDYRGIHIYEPVDSPKIAELEEWKARAIEYLQDLLKFKEVCGDHSYASHLRIFIKSKPIYNDTNSRY